MSITAHSALTFTSSTGFHQVMGRANGEAVTDWHTVLIELGARTKLGCIHRRLSVSGARSPWAARDKIWAQSDKGAPVMNRLTSLSHADECPVVQTTMLPRYDGRSMLSSSRRRWRWAFLFVRSAATLVLISQTLLCVLGQISKSNSYVCVAM